MAEPTPSQQSLTAFKGQSSRGTQTNTSSRNTSPYSTTTQQSTTDDSPLSELYEIVNEHARDLLPETYHDIEPPTKLYTTKEIPECLPALPLEIGEWELIERGDERILYLTRGDAYDKRWGNGGGIYGVEVYLNNSGANKDGKYHRRSTTTIGFKNVSQIKHTDIDSRSDLYGIRGFNPATNKGDYGYSSGTQMKSETTEDAIIELLIYLQYHQQPLGAVIPTEPSTHWQLKKHSPRKAVWVSDEAIPTEGQIRLYLHENRLSIRHITDTSSINSEFNLPLPDINGIPSKLIERSGPRYTFPTVKAAIQAATQIISEGFQWTDY